MSELSVERTTVGNEGRGLGDVTDELVLGSLELVGGVDPSDLVISERVDKLVGLVHLSLGLHGLVHKGVLGSHLGIELSLKISLKLVDLVKLGLSSGKFLFCLSELNSSNFEESKLRLHNLGGLVIIGHSAGPGAETGQSGGGLLGDFTFEELNTLRGLKSQVRFEELNCLFVNEILIVF